MTRVRRGEVRKGGVRRGKEGRGGVRRRGEDRHCVLVAVREREHKRRSGGIETTGKM